MIYFGSFFAGIINGLFASGAGQILVFMLIFVLKQDTYKSRKLSVFVIGIVSLLTLLRYMKVVNAPAKEIVIVIITGVIFGTLGTKIIKKINPNVLNIFSGTLIVGLSLYKLLRGG